MAYYPNNPNGQTTMANSAPVTIASDQTPIPITGSITAENSSIGPTGDPVPADATMIAGDNAGDLVAVKVSATGVVSVDGSGVTQPVSGTVAISGTVPVSGPLTDAELRATPVPISGSVTANAGTNLNTSALNLEATQSAINTKIPSGLTVTSTRLLTDGSGVTQPISASSLPLPTGASTAANQATGNASLASIDTKLTSPLTVTGPLTDTQLRATPVDVNVTSVVASSVTVTNGAGASAVNIQDGGNSITVDGTVSISGTVPVSGPLTDTQLRATPVPVSGTVTANAGTGVFEVDGSGFTQPISASALPLPTGASTSALQTTGNSSLSSIDGKTPALGQALAASSVPVVLTAAQISTLTPLTSVTVTQATGTNLHTVVDSGTVAVSGSVAVTGPLTDTQLRASAVPVSLTSTTITGTVAATQSGTWNINNVSGTVSLPTGASTAAKQPALGTSGTASSDVITVQGIAGMTAVKVDGSAVTQPVSGTVTVTQGTGTNLHTVVDSGTVTANIGTTNGLALDATLTGGTQKTKLVDSGGANVATVSAAGAVKVDGSAVTQPVSGTVTANAGTNLNTSALALESGGNLATIKTNTDNLALAQASTTSGQKGNLVLGAVTTAAPTYTTAQSNPISLTTAGAVRTDSSATTQPISGSITASPANGSLTDRSGTATTSASTLAASNSSRKYFMIQNTSGGTLWIDFGATAVTTKPSIRIANNEIFIMDGSFISTQSISIIATAGSRDYTAKEG